MAFKISRYKFYNNTGFSLLEVLVSVVVFSIVFLVIISFLFWTNYSNSKTKADRETLENAKRALEIITYEIRGAKSVYTPTNSSSQLSLETTKYLPEGEINTFIDFFLCGTAICLKKESLNPIVITTDSIEITNLSFVHILNGKKSSVKIDLTANYKNPNNSQGNNSSVDLTSTVSLRSY